MPGAFGRWTFLAPLGYANALRASGKSLVADPDRAPLVRRIFKDFATGRFTKQEVLRTVTALGLKTRRGAPVPSQTFDRMLRHKVYIGQIDVPNYGVSTRGDFDPLVTERLFFRVQAILDGRMKRLRRSSGTIRTSSCAVTCGAVPQVRHDRR